MQIGRGKSLAATLIYARAQWEAQVLMFIVNNFGFSPSAALARTIAIYKATMAAKPSTAAEKALQTIQDQVTCGICLEPFTQPKLLNCFHVFCEKCLQSVVHRSKAQGQSLTCPHCLQDTALPASGVPGLQGAFYIHHLFEIQDALQKVSSSNQTMCNKCKKRQAACFCRTCGFVCQFCEETHQYWDNLSNHEIIDLDTLSGDVTTLVAPFKKSIYCSRHPEKEADLYCDECDELICRDCIVPARIHRNHQYDLVPESFAKQEKVIVVSLNSVKQQLTTLHEAVESLDAQCSTITEHKTAVVAEIGSAITQLQQALEVRKTELVSQAERTAQQKLKKLAAQKDELELKIAQLKRCQDFVEKSCLMCSQGEILRLKSPLVKQIDDLTGSLKPQTLALADLKFTHSLHELIETCQKFGKVHDERRDQKITQHPGQYGKRKLVEDCSILNSPSTVTFLPNFTAPTKIIRDLNRPWGIAVREGGEIVVSERDGHFVSLINANGEKKSFGTCGSGPGQFNEPKGVAIESEGNILVCDSENHRIQRFSPTGEHLKTVGTNGNGPLQFSCPRGIIVHPHTHKVYVTDTDNHRIQVLNSDLTYSSKFGSNGNNNGELNYPYGISTDSAGNVYVVDCYNHRIQVFSGDGQYLRQFGREGKGEGELDQPTSIALDSHNVAYVTEWGNNRISIFTTDGEFWKTFGSLGNRPVQFDRPFGIELDKTGTVYVCDTWNNRIQIFT